MRRNGLLGNGLYQFAELECVAVLELGRREEACIQQADARAEHADAETLLLKVVEKLLERDVFDLESVPNLVQLDLAIRPLKFNLGTSNGLAESKEWQSQVDEAVLVLLDIILAVNDLVELKDNQARNEGRCRGDGGDDLARDKLGLVSVSRLDLVVLRSQVAAGSDEVNVVVGVVILFEFDRLQLEARKSACRRKAGREVCELIRVIKAAGVGILGMELALLRYYILGL